MAGIEADLPDWFWHIHYDGDRVPPDAALPGVGANCQVFAYAVLAHFGRLVPPLRSSDLWVDPNGLAVHAPFQPLSILFFNPSADAYGAHLAVSLGGDRALHLSQRVGRPAIWSLAAFAEVPAYRVLLGGRRFG